AINAEQKDYVLALSDAYKNNKILLFVSFSFLALLLVSITYLFQKRKKERLIFEQIISELNQKLESAEIQPEKEKPFREKLSSTPNPVEEEILLKLEKFENSTKFTNHKLTISTLAVQMNTNTTYLSEVINNHKGKNFNSYINDLRI